MRDETPQIRELAQKSEELSNLSEQVRRTTSAALNWFVTSTDSGDWVIVDRSLLIASAVRDSLQNAHRSAPDSRKRRRVALALFELGDESFAPDLIDAVENDNDIFLVAAAKLANRGIRNAAPVILKRLQASLGSEHIVITTLLNSLIRLTSDLPKDVFEALRARHSKYIDDALKLFSSKSPRAR